MMIPIRFRMPGSARRCKVTALAAGSGLPHAYGMLIARCCGVVALRLPALGAQRAMW